ncbi:uncharacterized protein N7503_004536 [Penicillium pulvis]|uniref:uncharacterized protein n=1 Tax=Penicillium pulvis TaxID=1562058 RepID=UPI002547EDF8|nr:uncharacterized protein N7503_004536 [Penicillium pulvis]KAJ5802086.1 hypothetical protein N7503_004536 [Penicillium pulvis]
MSEDKLDEGAEYGAFPFDNYIADYQSRADFKVTDLANGLPSDLTNDQTKVLSIHQSNYERNICANLDTGIQKIWLRTCYDEDLNEEYENMRADGEDGITLFRCLDDSNRYAFDDGSLDHWRQVLVRVPGITDFRGVGYDGDVLTYHSGKNDEEMRAQCAEIEDEESRGLALTELEFQVVVCLLDREAIETGLIKILWLDEHGSSAWENRVEPSSLNSLSGAFMNGIRLDEITGGNSGRGSLISR